MSEIIRAFASSSLHHPLAKVIRVVTKDDYSHGGIAKGERPPGGLSERQRSDWRRDKWLSFEARGRGIDWYPWQDIEDGETRIVLAEPLGIPEADVDLALQILVRRYKGDHYAFGQFLATLPWVLLRQMGVERAIRLTHSNCCSELVARWIGILGGHHAAGLRGRHPDPNRCLPGDLVRYWQAVSRLWATERIA